MCLILTTTFKCKLFFTVARRCNNANYKANPCNKEPENVNSNFDCRRCAGDGDDEASSDDGEKLGRETRKLSMEMRKLRRGDDPGQ